MDWLHKSWVLEDTLYAPKRIVNNKGSNWYPHIIGSFYSQKNKCSVEYESLNERIFYSYLELDPFVFRYYVQPIEIPMITDKKEWFHIPDVLVFRQGSIPLLYQIKESPEDNDTKILQRNQACEQVCSANNWNYDVVYPKTLPETLKRNIHFLKGYLKKRIYYSQWDQKVLKRLKWLEPCSVEEISTSFVDSIDPLYIKPLVFHLIAHGYLQVDVNEKIDSRCIVTLNREMKTISILEART
ncbi:hypothetical protein ACPV3A_32720 [Paenibacillus sp. Dod16]|uniref:hypothetical protein n=1 Tax=Paenibacillus sp. Dod16 TaxID=3416392 RepID=UPI003CF98E3E